MKEYVRKAFHTFDAEVKVNELAKDGWQIISVEEDEGMTYVWMERFKPEIITKEPQLLQEDQTPVHERNTYIVD